MGAGGILGTLLMKVLSDDRVQEKLRQIFVGLLQNDELQEKLKEILANLLKDKILPMLPVIGGLFADRVIKEIPGVPDIQDVGKVIEAAAGDLKDLTVDPIGVLNKVIPDLDTGIGPLDAILDFWRPKQ